jgi:hypothetical protein
MPYEELNRTNNGLPIIIIEPQNCLITPIKFSCTLDADSPGGEMHAAVFF